VRSSDKDRLYNPNLTSFTCIEERVGVDVFAESGGSERVVADPEKGEEDRVDYSFIM
jgi:hypothetical protein